MNYTLDRSLQCKRPNSGWYCTRFAAHQGPCAVRARWWVKAIHKVTGKWY